MVPIDFDRLIIAVALVAGLVALGLGVIVGWLFL